MIIMRAENITLPRRLKMKRTLRNTEKARIMETIETDIKSVRSQMIELHEAMTNGRNRLYLAKSWLEEGKLHLQLSDVWAAIGHMTDALDNHED